MPADPAAPSWTVLSAHGRVLGCLARDPDVRLREVAATLGLTERAVQNLLGELEAEGLVSRERRGRRNHYTLHAERAFALPGGGACRAGDLFALLVPRAR